MLNIGMLLPFLNIATHDKHILNPSLNKFLNIVADYNKNTSYDCAIYSTSYLVSNYSLKHTRECSIKQKSPKQIKLAHGNVEIYSFKTLARN